VLRPRQAVLLVATLAIIALTGYVVVRFNAQEPTVQSADLRNAVAAEIRNAEGEVVLRGTFRLVEEEDDDIERKAALAPTTGGEVMGEAEVEFAAEMPVEQEVEFTARGLTAGATYVLVADGREITSVAADPRGRIAIEFNVPLPGARSFK
jgi:hypothetical protein